jgi:hypothetical protein
MPSFDRSDPMRTPSPDFQPDDDVDRLFARLQRAPVPPDLTARVLASTVDRPRPALAWPWIAVGMLALATLSAAGYLVGANLARTDGIDLIEAIFGDMALIAASPGEVVAALGEVLPWPLVGLAGVSAAFLVSATGRVVKRLPSAGVSRARAGVG